VLITGCGHSTIQRIVERAEMLFDEPIYGIVGGLHYPVTVPPEVRFGLQMQRILGTGKWPWDPINKEDVEAGIACLQSRHPQLVALSPHDSCAWSIEAFRRAFDPKSLTRQVRWPNCTGCSNQVECSLSPKSSRIRTTRSRPRPYSAWRRRVSNSPGGLATFSSTR